MQGLIELLGVGARGAALTGGPLGALGALDLPEPVGEGALGAQLAAVRSKVGRKGPGPARLACLRAAGAGEGSGLAHEAAVLARVRLGRAWLALVALLAGLVGSEGPSLALRAAFRAAAVGEGASRARMAAGRPRLVLSSAGRAEDALRCAGVGRKGAGLALVAGREIGSGNCHAYGAIAGGVCAWLALEAFRRALLAQVSLDLEFAGHIPGGAELAAVQTCTRATAQQIMFIAMENSAAVALSSDMLLNHEEPSNMLDYIWRIVIYILKYKYYARCAR
mmetsp:Transcript_29333/g.75298  ORF Transcript_29333/g.75298 Transcript_29333/m.75298 type:complete len:279 (-) Transcript_29333:161-997(-)